MTEKILIVDDEQKLLNGLRRQLSDRFEVDTAQGGEEGLRLIESDGPYAVVVSDMRMPEMNGIEFLIQVMNRWPTTIRMMLTGNADQQTATDAVNLGQIFQFLTKPCPADRLAESLQAGLEQYKLAATERDILSSTLNGSIGLMSEMLSVAKPLAFSRASRIARMVPPVCELLEIQNAWQIKLAAMLSQVGCIAIPDETLLKIYASEAITSEEVAIFAEHPKRGFQLINKIPRMQQVAQLVVYQESLFDPSNAQRNKTIPYGSYILKTLLDFDTLRSHHTNQEAFTLLSRRQNRYDPRIIDALGQVLQCDDEAYKVVEVNVAQLEENMILDAHLVSRSGDVLIAAGHELTRSAIERVVNFSTTIAGVSEPIRVRVPIGQATGVSPTEEVVHR